MVLKKISRCLLHLSILVVMAMASNKEEDKCLKPQGNSCTDATPDGTQAAGLGSHYQFPCHGVGCNFLRPNCRLCANDPSLIDRPYPECPKCVPKVEGTSEKPSRDPTSVCQLPRDHSCTDATPDEMRAAGLGVYYQFPCSGVGCNFMGRIYF